MNLQKIKYFIFRFGLGWIPDSFFLNIIRFVNAFRFHKKYYLLSKNSFFGQINRMKRMIPGSDMLILADKSKMRSWLYEKHGLTGFVPLIAVFKNVNELIVSDLNYPCIIKMNRGSGMNRVIRSRKELMMKSNLDAFRFWFSVDPYYYSRESHYSNMKGCLVVEEFLGGQLHDYKVFCFNGKPKFIQVDIDRFSQHKRAFYDLDWNLMELGMIYPKPEIEIKAPVVLKLMIETSALIAESFKFVRVDFYVQNNKLIIGECTFFPEGGMGLFDTRMQDEQIGAMFLNN